MVGLAKGLSSGWLRVVLWLMVRDLMGLVRMVNRDV